MRSSPVSRTITTSILTGGLLLALPGDANAEPTGLSHEILTVDSFGRLAPLPRDQWPASWRALSTFDLNRQIPTPLKGTRQSDAARQRTDAAHQDARGTVAFPAAPPRLAPFLANLNETGNTALRSGSLLPRDPFGRIAQETKFRLSDIGLRYSLEQAVTSASLGNALQGESALSFYTFDLNAKWVLFDAPGFGAGGLTGHFEIMSALGAAAETQSAATNLGSLTNPTGTWSSDEGIRIPELAWQHFLADGSLVIIAGVIDQSSYLDANAYANNNRGQFINSALKNSQVLPLPDYNLGINLQWQPRPDWYAILGTSAGDTQAGHKPWVNFNNHYWSVVGEVGYTPEDVTGLGPGAYRIQPFIAQKGGATQGGAGFNFQQQLGMDSPFGIFGRIGFGGTDAAAHAKSQISTGLVMHAPLAHLGWVPQLTDDMLGSGFIWSQPADTTKTIYHENEYVWDTFYTLQLTPLMRIQPDFQVVWNPAFNPDSRPATVFQLQMILKW